jgi:hypothetical protein
MPAKTEKQRRAMAIALALKTGKFPKSKAGKNVKQMASSMTVDQLKDFAEKKAYYHSYQYKEDLTALKQYIAYLRKIGA